MHREAVCLECVFGHLLENTDRLCLGTTAMGLLWGGGLAPHSKEAEWGVWPGCWHQWVGLHKGKGGMTLAKPTWLDSC
jgi:hypothetical protein